MPTTTTPTHPLIGRYARSVESGWLGKIIGVRQDGGETMCEMHGVSELHRAIKGGDIEDAVDTSDTQYFTTDDLKLLRLV